MKLLVLAGVLLTSGIAVSQAQNRLLLQYKANDPVLQQDVADLVATLACPIETTVPRADQQALLILTCELTDQQQSQLIEQLTQSQMMHYAEFDQRVQIQSSK